MRGRGLNPCCFLLLTEKIIFRKGYSRKIIIREWRLIFQIGVHGGRALLGNRDLIDYLR